MHDELAHKDALFGIGAGGDDAIHVDAVDGPCLEIVPKFLLAEFGFGTKQCLQVHHGGLLFRIHSVEL